MASGNNRLRYLIPAHRMDSSDTAKQGNALPENAAGEATEVRVAKGDPLSGADGKDSMRSAKSLLLEAVWLSALAAIIYLAMNL